MCYCEKRLFVVEITVERHYAAVLEFSDIRNIDSLFRLAN